MFGSAPSLTSGTTVSVEDVSTDSVGGAIITSSYGSLEVKQQLSFGRLISHCSKIFRSTDHSYHSSCSIFNQQNAM